MKNKQYSAFSLPEVLVIFTIITMLIMITMPGMSVLSNKKSAILPSIKRCIADAKATSVNSASGFYTTTDYTAMTVDCAGAIRGCSYNDSKSCNSIIYFVNNGTASQSSAATKVLRASCDLGGKDACAFFVKSCFNGSCEDSLSVNDLRYYLELAYTDNTNPGRAIVETATQPHYDMGSPSIVSEVDTTCDAGIADGIINTACKIKGYMPELKTQMYYFNYEDKSSFIEEDGVNGTLFNNYLKLAKGPQLIPTRGGWDGKSFSAGGKDFLFVSSYYDNTTKYDTYSILYGWDATQEIFTEYQRFNIIGIGVTDSYVIDGNTYLSMPSMTDNVWTVNGYHTETNSFVYKWDTSTQKFVFYQNIPTQGGRVLKNFLANGSNHLAVANYTLVDADHDTKSVNSTIYNWDSATSLYTFSRNIGTEGATDWEPVYIGTDVYLALANFWPGSQSQIYKWNTSTNQPDLLQSLNTPGALDWESFTIGTNKYLAVANEYTPGTYALNSVIYKWNPSTGFFEFFQNIPTSGAKKWTYFTIGSDSYLAIANGCDSSGNHAYQSDIYKWNGSQFVKIQSVNSSGAGGWEKVTIGYDTFIFLGNGYESGWNTNSKIFHWTGNGVAQPTKDNYYVTTSNNNHLSSIYKIRSISILQTEPPNCQIRWLISFDGRNTWKKWNGIQWQTELLSNIYSNGNTKDEVELGLKNYDIVDGEYLDFAVGLKSTALGFISPSVDQVKIIYQ